MIADDTPVGLGPALRLHIRDFLAPGVAAELHRALVDAAPWSRTFLAEGKGYDVTLSAWAETPRDVQQAVEAAVVDGARKGFQFDFESWRISDELEAGRRRGGGLAPLEGLYDFLNSEAFLGKIRTITGDPRPAYVDAQATRYRAGHFLTTHDDDLPGKDRLYAYVLNLTPDWRPDWGGLLLFQGLDGHVSEGLVPRFNALNLFSVPQPHCVTQVASFVTASRLSVTGWIRSRRPGGAAG
jgi:SM-20-related protein